jgi:hypothetical protein
VIFDFPQPNQRDLLETIMLLGGLSAFVIAEITDPRSSPMEVLAIASNFGVPIFPILEKGTRRGNREVSTFAGLRKFSWVLPTLEYNDTDTLLQLLQHEIVAPAMAMRRDIANRSGVRPWSAG